MSDDFLTVTYKPISERAKPPQQNSSNSWVIYAYLMSESGRSIQAVIPPKTIRPISSGVSLTPPKDYALHVTAWPDHMLSSPALLLVGSNVNFPILESEPCTVYLYNAGHESIYFRNDAPLAVISLQQKAPYFNLKGVTDVNIPSKRS